MPSLQFMLSYVVKLIIIPIVIMVSALTFGSAVQIQDPAWHIDCVVLLQGKTLCFLVSVSLHPGVQMGTRKLNTKGDARGQHRTMASMYHLIQGGIVAPNCFVLLKPKMSARLRGYLASVHTFTVITVAQLMVRTEKCTHGTLDQAVVQV